MTKIDVLDGLPELKIGVGYEIGGQRFSHLAGRAGGAGGGGAGV